MQIEGEDGTRIELRPGSEVVCGRGSGFRSADRTVSRRQVLFRADDSGAESGKVSLEVLGMNPVWVRSGSGGEVRAYRRSEKGELMAGDWICVSGLRPIWFAVKAIEGGLDLGSESEVDAETFRAPNDIDPVKEFGFLVIGHEFDQYPKQMRPKVKEWNWFLEESKKDVNDDEDDEDGKTKSKAWKAKKRKKVSGHYKDEGDEDEDWTGESEEEKEDLSKPAVKARKQTYFTRSKDHKVHSRRRKGGDEESKSAKRRASGSGDGNGEEEDEEDEEDETLGGFIVNNDDVEEEEEEGDVEEEEEEEEFIKDDDEED